MNENAPVESEDTDLKQNNAGGFFLDLVLYIAVMFLIREVYFERIGFLWNGLFWSFSTLAVATWRMKVRGVTWKEIGLSRPKNIKNTLIATGVTLGMAIGSIIVFEIVKDQIPFFLTPDTSETSAVSKFGDLEGNLWLFFSIIPLVLVESFLEELLDRGFLINWLERMFSKTSVATVLAVILQAALFGFRHSNDISERSITVGLIGLAMGISYVVFDRNLWPQILAHGLLNTISMLDRVG